MGNIKQEQRIICPVCKEILPESSRGRTLHADAHGLSSEELAVQILNNLRPLCACGCNQTTRWTGWLGGFSLYCRGHMKNETRSAGIEKLKQTLSEKHWARGLTKETSDIIMKSSRSVSSSMLRGFSEGKIKHWMAGKTAASDSRIAAAIAKRSENFEKRGHWHRMSLGEVKEKLSSSLCENFEILSGLSTYNDRKNNRLHECTIKCKRCGMTETSTIYNIIRYEIKRCQLCDKPVSSLPQDELVNFVGSLGVDCIRSSDRTNPTGYELDVYVPNQSFAIEFNGLYWHSSRVVDKQYHARKTDACNDHGISLLHIFQDEWEDDGKRRIIQSMIKNRLGLSRKIGARSCNIIELSSKDAKDFFNKNHIDGDTRGFVTYALMSKNEEIVAAIKLRRPYSRKWKGWIEIARYACLIDNVAVGGHSKLLSHIMKNYTEKLFTYVDMRFGGRGEYCKKSGMVLDRVTGCSFWWTDRAKRFNRLFCTAKGGKSEKENSEEKKLLKIWGCKNLVYVTKH